MELHIDLETYSSIDLLKFGVHKYVDSPDFDILLFASAFDDEPVEVLEPAYEDIEWVIPHLLDPAITKVAHNASFEIACLQKYFNIELDVRQWVCTAVQASEMGLPRSLGELSNVLKLSEDKAKKSIGRALIRYFCVPCKPTKVNGHRTRNMSWDDPVKWEQFKDYCSFDVEAERAIGQRLLQTVDSEKELWYLDQRINNRGAHIDLDLVKSAITIVDQMKKRLTNEAMNLTGLNNPNSVKQLATWLNEEFDDEDITTVTKDEVKRLIKITDDDIVTRVLEIRQELGKTSVKKYNALLGATCEDGRIRGTLLFYGANRTGRWAGRVFQPQNLPRNYLKDIDMDRWMAKNTSYDTMNMLYGSVADTLSQLIRTTIIPSKGNKLVIVDYSAVEARGLAWMAGEEWRLNVFKTHGKIYEASAAAAFKVPIDSIDKHSPLRQQGKVLELACGYGGSVGAIAAMDYANAIPEDKRKSMVYAWRDASPAIVRFWWQVDELAKAAVENPNTTYRLRNLAFRREKGFLFITLPSGRRLAYPRPMMLPDDKFGGMKLTYEGQDQKTNRWGRIDTYGPKLVENIIQALCRDLLGYGLQQLEAEGYEVIIHVHDEAVVDCPMDVSVGAVEEIFARKPEWAKDMPHRADGFESSFYKKD